MSDEIIKIRERLVELSKDPIETRELLDKLTYEEIAQHDAECPIIVTKNEIEETKDEKAYKLHKTRNGYLLQYYGGYSVFVDDKLISTASALRQIMDGVPADASDEVNQETGMSEKDGIELMLSAAEMIFRLPLFVLSHEITTLNIATMGTMYINLLQTLGEVPTAETDNPEYDKALAQMSELMEKFAAGLEKEGKEYERRMGYGKEADTQENKSQDKSQGNTEETKQNRP
jgi:hypothetical protein